MPRLRAVLGGPLGLLVLAIGSACATTRTPRVAAAPARRATTIHFEDHLAFAVRLEQLDLSVDGRLVYTDDGSREGRVGSDVTIVDLAPGAHTLVLLARASQPCGILSEPRMALTLHATKTFRIGEAPSIVSVDLFAREATSDPGRLVAVRFAGEHVDLDGVVAPSAADSRPECPERDAAARALCRLDALTDDARSRGDLLAVVRYGKKRAELRGWRDVRDDSFSVMTRHGTTAEEAERAQLRAKYAESQIGALEDEAIICQSERSAVATPSHGVTIDATCPLPDVMAVLAGW